MRLIHRQDTDLLFGLIDSNRVHLGSWHPWVEGVRSRDDAARMISAWEQQNANNRGFCAAILFDDKLCGVIHHLTVDWQNQWTAFSYWLDAAHQGHGIMTRCCRALIIHAFAAWHLNRVTIECAEENIRSRAIPERLGFKLEGIIRAAERLQDRHVDHAVYGLLRSECRFVPENWSQGEDPRPHIASHPPKPKELTETEPPGASFDQSLKLAFELHNAGRATEAEALCRVLEKIRPGDSQLLFLLGMILHKKNHDTEAVRYLSLAAQQQPDSARIFKGLGCALQGLKDHVRAVGAFERAIELQPQSADSYYNLGKSCYQLERVERAHRLFERAVEIDPRDYNSWNNLGKCRKELNRLAESIEAYNRAVEIAPDYALARYGRALSLLAAGKLTEGFQEFEWRWRAISPRQLAQPMWDGTNAPDKTLFIHAEQGFGDAVQMVRFTALVRKRVGRIILECRPELARLFQYSDCADVVLPYGSMNQPFDYFIPMMSLPRALGITRDNIPGEMPYLRTPQRELNRGAATDNLKVGIAWAGNPNHPQDAARSIPLQLLSPLLQVAGVTFYSLQHSVPSQDHALLVTLPNVACVSCQDFLDTGSIIQEMDVVITVDSAVAHLAGALGRPVWTLLQHSPDWRWFLDRNDSPWYPSMRLFRQPKRNDWTHPIERAAESLDALASSNRNAKKNMEGWTVKREKDTQREYCAV